MSTWYKILSSTLLALWNQSTTIPSSRTPNPTRGFSILLTWHTQFSFWPHKLMTSLMFALCQFHYRHTAADWTISELSKNKHLQAQISFFGNLSWWQMITNNHIMLWLDKPLDLGCLLKALWVFYEILNLTRTTQVRFLRWRCTQLVSSGGEGGGILWGGSEVVQRDAGSRWAQLKVSVHGATQAEWSLTVANLFGIIHYNGTLGILTSDTMHGNKEAMW